VANGELPEQLLAVKPSVSKNDAECPTGLRASSHEKLKAIFAPPGPASVADTDGAHEGTTTPDTPHTIAKMAPRFHLFTFIFFVISRPTICLSCQILMHSHP
jgi:hypothetical protein